MTEFGLNIEKHIFSKLHIIKIFKKNRRAAVGFESMLI